LLPRPSAVLVAGLLVAVDGLLGAGGRLDDPLDAFGAALAVAVAREGWRRRPPQPVTKYCWMMATVFETNQ
jgi:hypothetical protein